jgi:hypothetical protein
MTNGQKILGGSALALGTSLGLMAWKYNQMRSVDIFTTLPKITHINAFGFAIVFDLTIQNPTPYDFKFNIPYIAIHYNNIPIGSSEALNQMIDLPGKGKITIPNIKIGISVINILMSIPDIISRIMNKETVSADAVMHTSVPFLWGLVNIPYKRTKTISLKL